MELAPSPLEQVMKKLLILFIAVASVLNSASAQTLNLFTAARSNDVNLATTLLDAKADVNQTDDKGYTPLILATYNDNFEVAQLLLKHGANTDIKDNSGRTALMGASFKGNEREVKLLLDNGANANAADSTGLTSMMYAVMFGRISVIRVLRTGEAVRSTTAQVSNTK
jgi:ankyrin repeat protein